MTIIKKNKTEEIDTLTRGNHFFLTTKAEYMLNGNLTMNLFTSIDSEKVYHYFCFDNEKVILRATAQRFSTTTDCREDAGPKGMLKIPVPGTVSHLFAGCKHHREEGLRGFGSEASGVHER